MEAQWTLQDAKNKFSEVVNIALKGTPQVVTKRGVPAVVVMAVDQYEILTHKEQDENGFAKYLLSMPTDEGIADVLDNAQECSTILQLREVEF